MKNILGLAFGLMIAALSFGQSSPAKFSENMSSYDKTKTTAFHFAIDQSIKEETIKSNTVYYTDYFTVDIAAASGGGHNITITLTSNDELSRKVVERYFISMEIKNINVDGTDMPVHDFMTKYVVL